MSIIKFNSNYLGAELSNKSKEFVPKAIKALRELQTKECVGSEWTGWYNLPENFGNSLCDEVTSYVNDIDVMYDTVVVIGIGGSYLGTRAVCEALSHEYADHVPSKKVKVVYAGHHLSEGGLIELMEFLEHRQPMVNVISKSGTTTEPSVAFRIIKEFMERKFGKEESSKRIVATTDANKGALRELVNVEGYKSFVVPDDVGGRFSVLTAVGLVPLALAGYDIKALMSGANELFMELSRAEENHPVIQYAAARNACYSDEKRTEIFSYINPKLSYIAEWWKQLFGESEGKEGKGLFPASLCFTTDLHSLGQYVQDGVRNLIETFVLIDDESTLSESGIKKSMTVPKADSNLDKLQYLEAQSITTINNAAMTATKLAHFDGGVPCMEIKIPALDEKSIGALFAFYETSCAVSGAVLGVNPFDQPGVEDYKKNLFALMGRPGYEELANELKERL